MDVVFSVKKFRAIYPEFRDTERVPDDALINAFNIASTIVGNAGSSIPYNPEANPPVNTRETVLYLVTCHIATMAYLWDASQTGAVASATQGSVSVSYDTAKSPEWWRQTKCGATAYQILKGYRSGLIYYGLHTIYQGG